MSVLVILIPPRARLGARAADGAEASGSPSGEGYGYVLSADGLQVSSQGARSVAAAAGRHRGGRGCRQRRQLAAHHRCPRRPRRKLRAALGGLLEEHLLDDDEALHLALAPGAQAGSPVWVAAMHKAWLRGELERLEKGGLSIERVLPCSWPGDTPQGHFFESTGVADRRCPHHAVPCRRKRPEPAAAGRLAGAGPACAHERAADAWTAEPAVAAPAERWLGASVTVQTEAERALQAVRSLWNLRQFDLAPRASRHARAAQHDAPVAEPRLAAGAHRPGRAAAAAGGRAERLGLAPAPRRWSQQRMAQDKLLRATFPNVRAVLDAPLQMRRETEVLRTAAGRAGDSDLEALLRRRRVGLARRPGPGADACASSPAG